MMFASKAQPDRFPYRVGEVRVAYQGTIGGIPTVEDPRPYDPAMNNPPNPIIEEFRKTISYVPPGITVSWLARHWTQTDEMWAEMCLSDDELDEPICLPEHEEHARKVLTRLANLEQ